jgi:hypothetical protein
MADVVNVVHRARLKRRRQFANAANHFQRCVDTPNAKITLAVSRVTLRRRLAGLPQ